MSEEHQTGIPRRACLVSAGRYALAFTRLENAKKNNACSAGYLTLLPLLTPAVQAALKFLIAKLEFYF